MKKNLEAKIMMQLNAGAMKAVFGKKELIHRINAVSCVATSQQIFRHPLCMTNEIIDLTKTDAYTDVAKQIKNVLDAYWEQQEQQRNKLHITIHMKQSGGLYVIAEDGGYDGSTSSVTMDINYTEQSCIWHFTTYLSYGDETDEYRLFGRESSEWAFTEEAKEPLHEIVKYATEILELKDPKVTFEVINGVLL